MARNDVYIYTNATSPANAVITAQQTTTAATFPDLVLGDSPLFNFYFTDGTASWPSWAGNGAYTIEWAIGESIAADDPPLALQTQATTITGGWQIRLPLATGALINALNNVRVGQEFPVVRLWQHIRVKDSSGYAVSYALIRTNVRLRSVPDSQVTPDDPLPSGTEFVLVNAGGQLVDPTNLLDANTGTGVADFLRTPSSANLRTALTDKTGTGSAVFGTGPTISSPTISGTVATTGTLTVAATTGTQHTGTTTNDNAATGYVGEFLSSTGAAISMTTATDKTITSVSLGAGDWDVEGTAVFAPSATPTLILLGISSTDNVAPTGTDGLFYSQSSAFPSGSTQQIATGTRRFSISSTTTVYLVARTNFASGTCLVNGTIRARRVR